MSNDQWALRPHMVRQFQAHRSHDYIYTTINELHCIIKTHGSELRGQEEAGLRDKRVSYLQVAPL